MNKTIREVLENYAINVVKFYKENYPDLESSKATALSDIENIIVPEKKIIQYELNPEDVYANDYLDAKQKAELLHERSKAMGYNTCIDDMKARIR